MRRLTAIGSAVTKQTAPTKACFAGVNRISSRFQSTSRKAIPYAAKMGTKTMCI